MTQRLHIHGLDVSKQLAELVALNVAPGTGIEPDHFWKGLASALDNFMPRTKNLLAKRDQFQQQIDHYYTEIKNDPAAVADPERLATFLKDIGYLVPEQRPTINVDKVDAEIATVPGPQLVVPVMNARYALNAANARWGSLYDALYGSDIISDENGAAATGDYNPQRGQKVVEFAAQQLDLIIPLKDGLHSDVTAYSLIANNGSAPAKLEITLQSGTKTFLQDESQLVGFGDNNLLLFVHHGLHIELHFDAQNPIGKAHAAGLKDVILEAAMTTIQDCEDSVAAVDSEDKVVVYRHWLGLMQGNLVDSFVKNGQQVERRLAPDRHYTHVTGEKLQLPGRSLMLVRNVGHLMTTDAVLRNGEEIPEGILDGFMTAFAALHDLKALGSHRNSRQGSMYIVKPKMHGPDEVQLTVDLFAAIETTLSLPNNTLKLGIMDEERRTTLNLGACIAAAKERVIFINTGFLDRTGDEIHTCMQAGPVVPKNDMKSQAWIQAYEKWNVDHGLSAKMRQQAQIGKGMWPKPDLMKAMLDTKAGQLREGASCAWVPSPTAAVLHALHYHHENVNKIQQSLEGRSFQPLQPLLQIPLAKPTWSKDDIRAELDNNAQGILGYVVRWVQQGIGCSKVPDIHDVGLMEDRATLRISSQHMANWLEHGVCTEAEVMDVMKRMASVVDRQNVSDPAYTAMTPNLDDNLAFKAACDLVFNGRVQPNGYTEPLLHAYRKAYKAQG